MQEIEEGLDQAEVMEKEKDEEEKEEEVELYLGLVAVFCR